MANYNCDACDQIRSTDPNLLVNGFTDTECTSLKNNTGLNPSSGHDDCDDLNNLNDCLVKSMDTEINSYNACSWKEFMKLFIGNLWTTLKAIICAVCGIWTNIKNIWNRITIIENKLASLDSEVAAMPHEFLFSDVEGYVMAVPGEPARINIPVTLAGWIPLGLAGWNFSNAEGYTGVSKVFPWQAKLQTNEARFEMTNMGDHNVYVRVRATVIYYRFRV